MHYHEEDQGPNAVVCAASSATADRYACNRFRQPRILARHDRQPLPISRPRFHPTTRAAKQHDALAGTNRAGKTTCIECLLDLRHVMARIQ